ncbi:hypothetical protein [Isoptericola variabilis]|uniref:Uncharacterized protein n=1 Tax=Isoptericola variabilis (strain 225) TaxID=743718 RepID=F6FPD9_ISOV2|nr:hypothetical protein [Isoptericola variabilis]AEG43652.1 hypothetical protein Isova_0868 [Isoptericola variabilis 225]TWH27333.1 hypothetical protein L600_000500000060 [Isoptericola variabilis J7]TWH31979.1 hypothetical protein L600_000200000030 [Isoptericola variabilis J7]
MSVPTATAPPQSPETPRLVQLRESFTRRIRGHKVTTALAALLAVAAVYGIVAGVANARWEDHAAALETELADLRAALDDARAAEQDALDRATSAEGRIADAEARAEDAEAAAAERAAELDELEATLAEREKAVTEREEAVTAVENRIAETQIQEGTWTVGVDIEPGTYRTTEPVNGDCYWGIYRSGSNKSDIVDNDIVTGGYPTVTLREGQDFQTSRCGSWNKQ